MATLLPGVLEDGMILDRRKESGWILNSLAGGPLSRAGAGGSVWPSAGRWLPRAPVSIGRMVTAQEVAAVVAFLASPKSVALNGGPIVASGGTRGPIHY